jgi:succinyl-CoA synthetase beta subunit
MKIHEFQAKQLFKEYGVPCPEGITVCSRRGAQRIPSRLPEGRCVVKAQIHAGGRGKGRLMAAGVEKGRGVQVHAGPAPAAEAASAMLGCTLVTAQTGPAGRKVRQVLVEKAVEIKAELYLALVLDRESGRIALMASTEGGTEIEEVARKTLEKIHTVRVDPLLGYRQHHGRNLAVALRLPPAVADQLVDLAGRLYRLFLEKDCSLVEINPLVLTAGDRLMALDGKVNFDDNGLFRHPEVVELQDLNEEEPSEVEAAQARLSYIKLDGNIGCLVNGAGLAMATMDIIREFGGAPANFLDVGGTATAENVARSFQIMLKDKVAGIFVNVFGGIVRCDVVAQGLVEALSRIELEIPVVVRLQGNRKEEASQVLQTSGLPLTIVSDMKDGARKIVEACGRTE